VAETEIKVEVINVEYVAIKHNEKELITTIKEKHDENLTPRCLEKERESEMYTLPS